ncbi:MAG: sulfatase-like hydrolase/transferase [Clostridiales bacterium]|nr:sulfatase-like hydrolase/transferase [Clostridiales bacterium]
MSRSVAESVEKHIAGNDGSSTGAESEGTVTSSYADEFYSSEVADYREKDAALPEQPNVILIFTEGLSQSVIDDEREIMPNVAAFQEESLNFTGYYNHTFATYCGLIGQLYSEYQWNNLDENNLVSIQSLLSDNGYHTTFINTEPNNADFTSYLESMGFDEVLGDASDELLGMTDSYSDKQAYEYLLDTAESLSESDEPFFLSVYTFGTHASNSSANEVFGDGSDDELNKFYDADAQFGEFLENFKESELAENTILVFTSDHATYQDSGFTSAFPDYDRAHISLDEIPLSIYYVGIEPETIDVDGRNSLDLAPTILDYLDISGTNYFLGESLFADPSENLSMDMIYYSEASPVSTKNGQISSLSSAEESEFKETVYDYFVAKLSETLDGASEMTLYAVFKGLQIDISDDGQYMEVACSPRENASYEEYWFAVWSDENGQDDVVWYETKEQKDGTWSATIPLSAHTLQGGITIHVYVGNDGVPETLYLAESIIVP